MAGEQLHEFDLALCDYVLSQIRSEIRLLERPRLPLPELGRDGYDRLTYPEWLGRGVAFLSEPFADYVWAGVTDEVARLPLNDAELDALESLVHGPPSRHERKCVWFPHQPLHGWYVRSVSEIRTTLAPATADEWARDSVDFGAKLCEDELPLADGIEIVHEWLWRVRQLLEAMGAWTYLPAPAGSHPTPTNPSPAAALPDGLDLNAEWVVDGLRELRRAIAELPDGRKAKPPALIAKAGINAKRGRDILRHLEGLGEYRGFGRARPRRYRPGR